MIRIEYMLEVSLCWFILFGFYHFLLRKETFFNANRAFLLSALIGGLALPLLRPLLAMLFAAKPVYSFTIEDLANNTDINIFGTTTAAEGWDFSTVLFGVYWLGVVFFSIRLLRNLFQIHQLKQGGKILYQKDYTIIQTNALAMPFSFGQWLFVPNDFERTAADEQKIIQHELVHIREKHSLDIIILEILTILFWFNPVLLAFQTALKEVHEYAADKEVLRSTPVKNYGYLLLQQAFPNIELRLIHNFNQSQLKKRIKMMTKKPSAKGALLKYIFIAPVLIAISVMFSAYTYSNLESPKGEVDEMPYVKKCANTDKQAQQQCSITELMTFLSTNVLYPENARKAGVEGMAVISFVVSRKGEMKDLKIAKDPGNGLGEAALEAIQKLAKSDLVWEPGRDKGKKVDVEMKLPIKFKLDN
jgi:bla regulator protein blaR1